MKYRIFILLCIFQVASVSLMSQEHLKIKNIFDKYGKKEGSILVQLSSDVLSQGSNMTFYKSLIINQNKQVETEILDAVKADTNNKIIVSEVKKNGAIESGSYYLGNNSSPTSEFILYKNKSGKITLVYLKGNFPSGHLDEELKKLKDLFIYVNNKRLKIQ
ncbi:MAG: hypothetical protein ACK5KT_13390 [Dysgonomonas sp.]